MADPVEMTCQELVELVTDYLEESLPTPDRARFEAHLADCDDCPLYLEQMRLTISITGRLTDQQVSPVARRELLARFRTWHETTNAFSMASSADPDNPD